MAEKPALTATEFKAKCLTAPTVEATAEEGLHGFMRGSVVIPEGLDLTAPVVDEPFDAEQGILHRT